MNELHLFAGAGGGILGGILLGHTCVCAVEIEPYCRRVLLQRQRDEILPRFPIWDDVRTFDGKPWRGKVDCVCGGFPCVDISCAANGRPWGGAGIDGAKSGLWSEMARIISEVRPRFVFVENSPMLTIRGLGRVLGDLAELGYDARWGVLGYDQFGGRIRRKRIWIVADSNQSRLERIDDNKKPSGRIQFIVPKHMGEAVYAKRLEGVFPKACGVRSVTRMADYVDRIKAIGNGQVPAVAASAFRILS